MSNGEGDSAKSLDGIRAEIAKRLRVRRSEIVQAITYRIQEAVPDALGAQDRSYQAGVFAAVEAVLDYSLEAIEHGPTWEAPIPSDVVVQAHRAARAGVSLGVVLRRYLAGHRELGEFVMAEAQRCGLSNHGSALHQIRRLQETLLEHLTVATEGEYNRECERVVPEQRRADIVRKLLSDETVNPAEMAELDYEVHTSWHLGLIATGTGVEEVLRALKAHFGRRLLPISLDGRVWAWLGGRERPVAADIERLSINRHIGLSLAIGEPGRGIDGWRLTHNQAQDALDVALRKPDKFARYADGRVLAAAVQNETLARSLRQKYLVPLRGQRDGGVTLRRTLRVYIDLECNATSAAELLKVGRRAVKNRVWTAERLIGCSLGGCLGELDAALRLDELDRAAATDVAPSMQ